MNTHTFGNHYVTCPICQRHNNPKPVKLSNGLFTCPHCQERLVVSWSGHYVRDPHNHKQHIVIPHVIRRQSRPWARIIRDLGSIKRSAALMALGSAIVLGVSFAAFKGLNDEQQPVQGLLEQVTDMINPPDKSHEQ